VNVFLSRLNGEPIGFSVLGIFVIDKNTILTVNCIVEFQYLSVVTSFWNTYTISIKYRCITMLAGLISKVSEDLASESSKKCRCRQPHCRLTPLVEGPTANICTSFIMPETRFPKLHFLLPIVWNFGTNRKSICDFLLVINNNLGPILHHF